MEELNWEAAKAHFDSVKKTYQDMEGMPGVNTTIALLAVFQPLEWQYEKGDRSQKLFDEMMAVE